MTDKERADRCRADLDYFAARAGDAAAYLYQAKLEIMRIVSDSGESRRTRT